MPKITKGEVNIPQPPQPPKYDGGIIIDVLDPDGLKGQDLSLGNKSNHLYHPQGDHFKEQVIDDPAPIQEEVQPPPQSCEEELEQAQPLMAEQDQVEDYPDDEYNDVGLGFLFCFYGFSFGFLDTIIIIHFQFKEY